MTLPLSFFSQKNAVELARELLGKELVTSIGGEVTSGLIVETEAYLQTEKACHAYNGRKTKRTMPMFEEGGMIYVFLVYGIHELFNIVSGPKGSGEAVLIRAVQPMRNNHLIRNRAIGTKTSKRYTSGPGKLTKGLNISIKNTNTQLREGYIWIEDCGINIKTLPIVETTRIGVDFAGKDAKLPYRFYLENNKWVSKF